MEAHLEEVACEEVGGTAGGVKEGLPRDGHAHRGKLGEVLHQAVDALHAEGGNAGQQVALVPCLLSRPAKPHPQLTSTLTDMTTRHSPGCTSLYTCASSEAVNMQTAA